MKLIKYNMSDSFSPVVMGWSEANEEIAKREALNGQYIVEDDGQPEPENVTTDDIVNALLGVTSDD